MAKAGGDKTDVFGRERRMQVQLFQGLDAGFETCLV